MEKIKYEYKARGIGHVGNGESARGNLVSMWPLCVDPPTETNRHSHQGHSSVFVPKRKIFLSGMCFEMVC